jgi:hypothetical protein
MVSDEIGMELHNRHTLGEPLTAQEAGQLEAWYAEKDAAEAAMFAANAAPWPNLTTLQAQVDQSVEQLTLSAQRLQQITVENNLLREEIAELKQQLATPRSA